MKLIYLTDKLQKFFSDIKNNVICKTQLLLEQYIKINLNNIDAEKDLLGLSNEKTDKA